MKTRSFPEIWRTYWLEGSILYEETWLKVLTFQSPRSLSVHGATVLSEPGFLTRDIHVSGNGIEFTCRNVISRSAFQQALENAARAVPSSADARQSETPRHMSETVSAENGKIPYIEFHLAVIRGDVRKTQLFIEQGGDVNSWRNETGEGFPFNGFGKLTSSALSQLCYEDKRSERHMEIANLLLGSGINVNDLDISGQSSLCIACIYNREDMVNLLLKNGANPNHQQPDSLTFTPLMHVAYHNGSTQIAKSLIDWGVDTNTETHGGRTAFDIAEDRGHLEFCGVIQSQ